MCVIPPIKSHIIKTIYVKHLIRERFSLNVNITYNTFLYSDFKKNLGKKNPLSLFPISFDLDQWIRDGFKNLNLASSCFNLQSLKRLFLVLFLCILEGKKNSDTSFFFFPSPSDEKSQKKGTVLCGLI